MIAIKTLLFAAMLICFVHSLPTVYKYNDNKLLEPDLVPVSSTVIPLPVYQVSYGIHVAPSLIDEKVAKPKGPISLVTVHSKKAVLDSKIKSDASMTSVKEVSKKDFHD